jgi:hypothetical protein
MVAGGEDLVATASTSASLVRWLPKQARSAKRPAIDALER